MSHHDRPDAAAPRAVPDDGAADARRAAPADRPLSLPALAARLAELEDLLGGLAYGVQSETDALREELAGRLAVLEQAGAGAGPSAPGDEPEPRAWVDGAGVADWQELAAWVDWLTRTYDLTPSRAVLPCWPAHRGVAEELAALRAAWRAAATAARAEGPNDQLVYWHDRWLHPCLSRLREAYKLKQCADRHVPIAPARSTDPDLLAAAPLDAAADHAAALTPLR